LSHPPSDAGLRIYRASVRKSPFVGVYCAVSEDNAIVSPIVPYGFVRMLEKLFRVKPIVTTIGSISSVGSMIAMNSTGAAVPTIIDEDELTKIGKRLNVLVVEGRSWALGNLIVANDKGCVISDLIPPDLASRISECLGVDYLRMSIGKYKAIGSLFAVSNEIGVASPVASEEAVARVSNVLQIQMVPTTVNDGEKLVKLGTLVNDRSIVVGKTTTGVELMSLQSLSR